MPENWKTYKLIDLTTKIGSGATPRGGKGAYKESGISLIRSQNVLDFSFSSDGLAFIDDDQAAALKNVTIESQDVLLNITGDSVARVCKVPNHWLPARVNQHVAIIRANEKLLNPDFLLYSLLSKENKNLLLTMAGAGATRNALTKTMIEEFEISIPAIQEQKSIASILSALDDKIELNLQMNKTLEEMAMALYKHWFVDFGAFQEGEFVDSELGEIPKGWEVTRMENIISVKDGTHDSPKRTEEGYHLITSKHIKTNEIDFSTSYKISEKDYHKINQRSKVEKDDILMTMIGTVGLFHLVSNEPNYAIKNIGLFKTSEKKEMKNFMFLFFKSQYSTQYIRSQLAGSTQQYLTLKVLRAFPVLQPPEQEILKFNIQIEEILELIEMNITENQTLTQLRDTLLPKLISGEVRVKDAEKTLSEVL